MVSIKMHVDVLFRPGVGVAAAVASDASLAHFMATQEVCGQLCVIPDSAPESAECSGFLPNFLQCNDRPLNYRATSYILLAVCTMHAQTENESPPLLCMTCI